MRGHLKKAAAVTVGTKWGRASACRAMVTDRFRGRDAAEGGLLSRIRLHFGLLANSKNAAGLIATIQWLALRLMGRLDLPQPRAWRLRPRQVRRALQVRLRGSSDMAVFDQIFIDHEYSCLREIEEPSLVLDLGANAGYSAAYFLNAFPKARVVAVEPDERNLAICRANLYPYGERVLLLHGAVWSRPATLQVLRHVGEGGEWATQVSELNDVERTAMCVQAWDVGSLIDVGGASAADLLKVDIERSELSVFGASSRSWLPRVKNICIELHGRACEEAFFAALKDFDYELGHSGELTICRSIHHRKAPQAGTDFLRGV